MVPLSTTAGPSEARVLARAHAAASAPPMTNAARAAAVTLGRVRNSTRRQGERQYGGES